MLCFLDGRDEVRVEAEVTNIGSFSTTGGTWKWAWANSSVVSPLRAKSDKLRELGELTGMSVFRSELFEADEDMPWEIAAMCVHHLGALGCYCGPAKNLEVYFAIDKIQTVGRRAEEA